MNGMHFFKQNFYLLALTLLLFALFSSAPAMAKGLEDGDEQEEDRLEDIFDRLSVYGDFRIRAVDLGLNRQNAPDIFQTKVRVRLGAEYEVVEDELFIGARLVTGDGSDPRSTDVSLGDGFEGFEISFDRAYLKYTPSHLEGSTLLAGKFHLPFKSNPVYGVLVWDSDVQPEGVAVSYDFENSGFEGFFTVGQYMVEETGGDISWLTAPQVAVSKSFNDDWKVSWAGGMFLYYGYGLTPGGSTKLVTPPQNRGNAVVLNGLGAPVAFVSDYYILDTFVDVRYSGFSMPIILSAEFIHNFGAKINQDTGFAIGAQVGKASDPSEWEVYYQFQLVEQDAIFTPFSQDDFLIATNFWGHVAGAKYRVTDNVLTHLRTLIATPDRIFGTLQDKTDFRLRAEVIITF